MQVGMWRRSIVRGTASSTDCERDRAFTDYDPESVIGIGAKVSPKQGTGLCGDGRRWSSGRALVEGRSNRTAETAAHGASNLHRLLEEHEFTGAESRVRRWVRE